MACVHRGDGVHGRRGASRSPLPRPVAALSNHEDQHGHSVEDHGLSPMPMPRQGTDQAGPSKQACGRSTRAHLEEAGLWRPSLSPLPRRPDTLHERNPAHAELNMDEKRTLQVMLDSRLFGI